MSAGHSFEGSKWARLVTCIGAFYRAADMSLFGVEVALQHPPLSVPPSAGQPPSQPIHHAWLGRCSPFELRPAWLARWHMESETYQAP